MFELNNELSRQTGARSPEKREEARMRKPLWEEPQKAELEHGLRIARTFYFSLQPRPGIGSWHFQALLSFPSTFLGLRFRFGVMPLVLQWQAPEGRLTVTEPFSSFLVMHRSYWGLSVYQLLVWLRIHSCEQDGPSLCPSVFPVLEWSPRGPGV